MQILFNAHDKHRVFEFSPESKLIDLRQKLNFNDNYYLSLNGRVLADEQKTLAELRISEFATIAVLQKLLGGKKKKKKQYTTPKKVKVPHKDIQKILLTQFAIQKDGSVKALKSECQKCGPGYFLGVSKGHQFCGNCFEKNPVEIK